MTGNVAVLSDVHGCLPALEAVLAEPEVRDAETIVLTGDVAAGPQPVETLDVLTALGERVVWVRGNADRELAELRRGEGADDPRDVTAWGAAQLREDQVQLLESLPLTAQLTVQGLGEVLFCHASPRDDVEVAVVDSRPARWQELLSTVGPEIDAVVCGHTHMPFARLIDGVVVVNPGSVGMPYTGRPGAYWALLGPGVTLRRTEFDYDAACARIAAESGYAGAAEWAEVYVRSPHSDVEALSVFAALDGR